ncbi:MAG TPA: ABC transporter permease subunit [Nocardioidaceae bacterium]|nr:ABC transporter permease subunit [Nocardioidaceae bacterium]
MAEATAAATTPQVSRTRPSWLVVASQELRDLWLSGKGLTLLLAYTVLLSISTYLIATNQELNFLEQREAVSLTLQLAVVVGALLVVLAAADAVSGERERGTLESLLLTAAPRRSLLAGKGLAALSLWFGALVVSIPYIWWIGRDVGTFGKALVGGFLVGTLLALFVAGIGLLVTTFSQSNGVSLAISFVVLLALLAPSRLPTEASRGWAGELLQRLDPFSAGLLYLERLIINAHSLAQDLDLLVAPAVLALASPALALLLGGRLTLLPRSRP